MEETLHGEGKLAHPAHPVAKQGWSWQAKLALAAVLVYLIIALTQYLKLQHLPGPFYGGDLYAHHGFALNYIANGFWTDPYFVGHYAFYPWLGNYLFIFLSLLPGLSLMQAEMYVGLLSTILSALAFWLLGRQLFKNNTHALIFLLIALGTRGIPDGAPNLMPWLITIPFWFAFWLRAEEQPYRWRWKLLAGLFMGLTSLAHVAFFIAGMALFAFTIAAEFVRNILQKKNRTEVVIDALKLYGPMLIAGFLVSLLFYGPIIANYHAKTLNPLFQYNGPDIRELGIGWMLKTLFRYTFDFSSLAASALTVLTLIGLAVCIMNFGRKMPRYAVWWYLAGALAPLHHIVTRPLLDRWVLPSHLWGIWIAMLAFAVYGIIAVTQYAEKRWTSVNIQRIALIGAIILSAALFFNQFNAYRANPWVQFGERLEPTTKAWLALGDWMRQNTDVNDVVLSGDETCFAMNGVSGRKCVFVRRTHANYFVDVEQRYADGVVMLYGNNTKLTKELLANYSVDYLLLDAYMQQSPILVETKYEGYLAQNGVAFSKVRARKDIATPNAVSFDLLAVQAQPLNKALEGMRQPVAAMEVNGQPYIQLFSLNQ